MTAGPGRYVSCPWCHELNPAGAKDCRHCGHRADRPRASCDCAHCRAHAPGIDDHLHFRGGSSLYIRAGEMRDVMALVKGFAVTAAGLRHVPQARRYLLLIERLYNNAARLQLTGAAGVRFITDPLGFAAEISGTSFTVN